MATKKKTVKKAARKAAKSPSPTIPGVKRVDPKSVSTLTRGRAVKKYVDLAVMLSTMKAGEAITFSPKGVKDVVRFRSSLVTSLAKTIEHLKLDYKIAVSTTSDKTGLLITRQ